MNREQIVAKLKAAMPEKRYNHSLGVEKTAGELAEKYRVSVKKARLAGLLHDYAKYMDSSEAKAIIKQEKMDPRLLDYNAALWHGPVGAYLVKQDFGITDPEILHAIAYHTTGTTGMSRFDKVIFLADYIEPGRDFEGVEEARIATQKSLDDGMTFALSKTIIYLVKKKQPIFPETFTAYNEYMSHKNKRSED